MLGWQNQSQEEEVVFDTRIEARQYMEEKIIPRKQSCFEWWRQNSVHYTLLSRLASKYLSCSGTSVPSERLFSKAGELVTQKRSRIKPKNVDMFLFLNQNSKVT